MLTTFGCGHNKKALDLLHVLLDLLVLVFKEEGPRIEDVLVDEREDHGAETVICEITVEYLQLLSRQFSALDSRFDCRLPGLPDQSHNARSYSAELPHHVRVDDLVFGGRYEHLAKRSHPLRQMGILLVDCIDLSRKVRSLVDLSFETRDPLSSISVHFLEFLAFASEISAFLKKLLDIGSLMDVVTATARDSGAQRVRDL